MALIDELTVWPLDALTASELREADPRHTRRLLRVFGQCPPITVSSTGKILDGSHRVAAARLLGHTRITCRTLDVTGPVDELHAALTANRRHGLPLTRADRHRAAARMIELAPGISDRALAKACGVSTATLATLRAAAQRQRPTGNGRQLDTPRDHRKRGADGRSRPIDPTAQRARVLAAIRRDPAASDRAIARLTGASPTTVGKVRAAREQQQASGPTLGSGKLPGRERRPRRSSAAALGSSAGP